MENAKIKSKVLIKSFGKNIIIDSPRNIKIIIKKPGRKAFKFNIDVNERSMIALGKSFQKITRRRL